MKCQVGSGGEGAHTAGAVLPFPPPGAQWGSLACVASYNMSIQLEALNRPRKALRALSDAINVPARARFF